MLADYKPESRSFEIKGNAFAVRGLSLDDIAKLIQRNLFEIESLFNTVERTVKDSGKLTDGDLESILIDCLTEVPTLVGAVVAIASDEDTPEAAEAVLKMPFPLQAQIVYAIVDLTFSEVGGIKNAFEQVAMLVRTKFPKIRDSVKATISEIQQQSGSTTGSDAT